LRVLNYQLFQKFKLLRYGSFNHILLTKSKREIKKNNTLVINFCF